MTLPENKRLNDCAEMGALEVHLPRRMRPIKHVTGNV